MDKTKLMVVDDEVLIAMELEEDLTSMGYEVLGRATSGEGAVEMARQLSPDAILMDIVMPGTTDGISAAEIIKTELDIPIIFLTAYADDQYIERAKAVEPFGYIVKPYQEGEVKAAIEITLYRKDIERRLRKSEGEYRSLIDNVSEAIVSADSHGNIIYCNQSAESIFGYLADEAVGRPITFIWPERFREAYQEEMGLVLSTGKTKFIGKTVESTGLRRDGGEFPLEFTLTAIEIKKEILFIVVARDITERKWTEEEREEFIVELKKASSKVKQLSGVLPICSYCKKIRSDQNYWKPLEEYIGQRTGAVFSHGVCPECYEKFIKPQIEGKKRK
jgi:PAS domain S-box-containing protein